MPGFSVVTLNIHKGFSALNLDFALERLRGALAASGADVAFLQEVVGRRDGAAPTRPQFEYLADRVWPHFAYGRNALHPRGHHGNAVLSKWPIVAWTHENLSTNRFEDRGLLHCAVRTPDAPGALHLLCVHLGLTERGRRAQVARLKRHVADSVPADEPLVLAGDFNDWRRRASAHLAPAGLIEAHEALHGAPARTFPAALPMLANDRVYLRGLAPISARVMKGGLWRGLSDHAALLVSCEYRPRP